MTRSTRQVKKSGIYSIPELRRSFEHIEKFVNDKKHHMSKEQLAKELQREWKRVFRKTLDKKSADVFVVDRLQTRRTTRKHRQGGGALPISGAPNDYTTRAGIYLPPGQIPNAQGGLPLSNGSSYGNFTNYVDKGFWNPEIAGTYDPVKGQPAWPIPMASTGSNAVHGGMKGGKRRTRRSKGGAFQAGAFLSQAFTHPVPSTAPPGILQDMQSRWHGSAVGPSPDQIQRTPQYQIGSVYPKPINF